MWICLGSSYLEYTELFRFIFKYFIKFRKFWTITFLHLSISVLLLGLQNCVCWPIWWCLNKSFSSFTFLHSFFFGLLKLNNFKCPPSCPLILSSACSTLMLNSSSKFFILLFSSRISLDSFLQFLSLLIFSFCLYIVSLIFFSYLSMFSLIS